MGMPARKLEFEGVTVEDRLAKLELTIEHIQSDVSEMKGDIRRLDTKIDVKFDEVNRKFDAKFDEMNRKFDAQKDSIAALALSTEKAISKLILWAVGLVAGLLTAHGFHWL